MFIPLIVERVSLGQECRTATPISFPSLQEKSSRIVRLWAQKREEDQKKVFLSFLCQTAIEIVLDIENIIKTAQNYSASQ